MSQKPLNGSQSWRHNTLAKIDDFGGSSGLRRSLARIVSTRVRHPGPPPRSWKTNRTGVPDSLRKRWAPGRVWVSNTPFSASLRQLKQAFSRAYPAAQGRQPRHRCLCGSRRKVAAGRRQEFFVCIAQLVEHTLDKREVAGSSPAASTKERCQSGLLARS